MAPFPAPIPAPAPAPAVYDNAIASRAIFEREFDVPSTMHNGGFKNKFAMDPWKTTAVTKLGIGRLALNTISTVTQGPAASIMLPDVTKIGQVYAERKMLKALVKGRKDINKMAFNSPEHGKATTSDAYFSTASPDDPRFKVKPGTKPQGNIPQQPMKNGIPPPPKKKRMVEDLLERQIDQLD